MDHIETADPVSIDTIRRIGAAFADRDVEGIVNSFADDGEFRNAKGPDIWGKSYKGKTEIRAFFTQLFANSPDIKWRHTAEYVIGNRGITEWHRTAHAHHRREAGMARCRHLHLPRPEDSAQGHLHQGGGVGGACSGFRPMQKSNDR